MLSISATHQDRYVCKPIKHQSIFSQPGLDQILFSSKPSKTRSHEMPFGVKPLQTGGFEFRLWAPSIQSARLIVKKPGDYRQQDIIMKRQADGFFTATSMSAKIGDHYGFKIDKNPKIIPDPASRFQPNDVHGLSQIQDTQQFKWHDQNWQGRPLEETVAYELHVGTFSPEGTFKGVEKKLDHLKQLGVTALQLMPIADFPGRRNWGYDGVLPFAPDSAYGTPDDLKSLVQAAHQKGIMVFLDVVYNHFGPDGNYLHAYAPEFFSTTHQTPWGQGMNFDGDNSQTVRDYFIHNALYWLKEFNIDGLRLDAVHAIADRTQPHFLEELSNRVHQAFGKQRQIHLMLENEKNTADLLARTSTLKPQYYASQWNDDFHNALHVLLTGETEGYYQAYLKDRSPFPPIEHLGRALTQGFSYQGEISPNHPNKPRGQASGNLPPTAFLNFLQNHDQIGNRAFGNRLGHQINPALMRIAISLLLLAPSPPLLFMGEEWQTDSPFQFFTDFSGDLGHAVREGRRQEFSKFSQFNDPVIRQKIPDPNHDKTFQDSKLSWADLNRRNHQRWLHLYQRLIHLRKQQIIPRLTGLTSTQGQFQVLGPKALAVVWTLNDGSRLRVLLNLSKKSVSLREQPAGRLFYQSDQTTQRQVRERKTLPAQSVLWLLENISPNRV